jgi:hypothetical protein
VTTVVGIDLGLHGAIVAIEAEPATILFAWDMPTWKSEVGKKLRDKIDPHELFTSIQSLADIGTALVVIEEPGFRRGQRGGGTVGIGAGFVVMACVACSLRYEIVNPGGWKASMKMPRDKKAAPKRATELFPASAHLFRGARGGALDGRADAAVIAKFGAARFLGIRS